MTLTPVRALGLISGGLDSAIALHLMQQQAADITCIHFTTPFFGEYVQHPQWGRIHRAEALARQAGAPIRIISLGDDYLELIVNPPHGYGSALNPCLDCHAFFLRKTRQILEQEGFDLVFTGEVMGQRPMSQLRHQLTHVERAAGLEGRLLRPLSARLLPPTLAEEQGRIDRSILLDICGRGRHRQLELAARYDLQWFSAPAGGCLLTDKLYARRLADLLQSRLPSLPSPAEISLLRTGRHFRLPDGHKYVAGRDQRENDRLTAFAAELGCAFVEPDDFSGPTILLDVAVAEATPEMLAKASLLLTRYTHHAASSTAVAILCSGDRSIVQRFSVDLTTAPDEAACAALDACRIDNKSNPIPRVRC